MSARPKARTITPLFVVSDLQRSIDFYARLGFGEPGVWGEPPCFAMMHRDGLEVMLSLIEGEARPRPNGHGNWDIFLTVDDLDAEIAALGDAGVGIDRGPKTTEYQMKEIEVVDPDGFRICLAQNMA
jgi:catechol 2,3-dioxygenase-like lactoylglutathione lyase family enzyme